MERCKEERHLKWWLEKQAGCVSPFHVVNEVSLTVFFKSVFWNWRGNEFVPGQPVINTLTEL